MPAAVPSDVVAVEFAKLSVQQQWARIVGAVTRPHIVPAPEDRAELLQVTLSLGAEVVPDLVGCSVTQFVDTDLGPGFRTPVASNELALALDRVQYALDDGPCVQACRDASPHSVAVMADEQAFAGFTASAMDHGVRSSLSLPLDHSRPSALNLYAGDPHAFADEHPRAAAAFLARCVAGLLPGANAVTADETLAPSTAQRRELVRMACTALGERDGVSTEHAFHRLTVLSREQQRSVFDIARSVVGSVAPDAEELS